MSFPEVFQQTVSTIVAILGVMGFVAFIETVVPLHAHGPAYKAHLRPNLALTFITFGTNIFLNAALLVTVVSLHSYRFGLLHLTGLPPLVAAPISIVVLDFSFYVAHFAMHKIPAFWRFHSVHHSDPAVDVTTTIRQHPGESLIRYAFLAVFAIALGPSPAAFAVYRVWSALNGLLEHANIRVPPQIDRALSVITTWPNLHKVHHSRSVSETDTNYGNIFSLFDRLFFTFTPSARGANVIYGLDGLDDPATQTTVGLLALPFRDARTSKTVVAATGSVRIGANP